MWKEMYFLLHLDWLVLTTWEMGILNMCRMPVILGFICL